MKMMVGRHRLPSQWQWQQKHTSTSRHAATQYNHISSYHRHSIANFGIFCHLLRHCFLLSLSTAQLTTDDTREMATYTSQIITNNGTYKQHMYNYDYTPLIPHTNTIVAPLNALSRSLLPNSMPTTPVKIVTYTHQITANNGTSIHHMHNYIVATFIS